MATQHTSELIRVKGPALPPVTLSSERTHTAPVSELIRVKGPALPPVTLSSDPTSSAFAVLTLPLVGGNSGEQTFVALNSIILKINEIEALCGRAGVWVNGTRSGVREGRIEIVLAPNDPTDALGTCKRVANYLFAAFNTAGTTLKVFAAESDAPVYELAA
ncbi:MAG: hypothetical protein FJ304_23535 [Planctomycetes bacterium]|nr:hypothetical protein [Planctomycetota bacterium]